MEIVPDISVLMPAYNEENHILQSITSILKQSFQNLELIIVDDGSTDKTVEIIEKIKDSRLNLIKLPENKGNRYAINVAIKNARGKYLVRQDADDISLESRLEKQFDFMESNPDIGFSGGAIEFIGNQSGVQTFPITPKEVQVHFLFGTSVSQPASIIRRSIIVDNSLFYEEGKASFAEDFQYFFRLSKLTKGANLSDTLIKYRRHDGNISSLIGSQNSFLSKEILEEVLTHYYESPSEEELYLHNKLRSRDKDVINVSELKKIYLWKNKLSENNIHLDQSILDNNLEKRWRKLYFVSVKSGVRVLLYYLFLGKKLNISLLPYAIKFYFNKLLRK